jgi:hypothetical protein
MTPKNAIFLDVTLCDSFENRVRMRELGTTLPVITPKVVPSSLILITLMIEAIRSSERRFLQESHAHPRRRHSS